MKKLVLIALLGVIGITGSNAQSKFRPGVKAGLNLSKFTNVDNASYQSDFYIGGQFGIAFTKFYTLQPEVVFSRQGSNLSYDEIYFPDYDPVVGNPQEIKMKYNADYLSLVVFNKFTFQGFYVGVGPSIDFLINDNFGDYGSDTPIGLDLSLHAGVGYTFPIGLTVEARIKQGMVDIFGNDYYYEEDGYDTKTILNQSFQIGVSYTFDFNKK